MEHTKKGLDALDIAIIVSFVVLVLLVVAVATT